MKKEREIEAIVSVFDATILTEQNAYQKDQMQLTLQKDFSDLLYEDVVSNPKIEKITCCVANGMIVHTAFISYDKE